jgi:hypothetical protein
VVGGAGAHFYINLARGYGATESESDDIGIIATHLASLVLLSALRRRVHDLYPGLAMSLAEIEQASRFYGAVVVGPLQKAATSSDSVAALTAEHVNAEAVFVKLRAILPGLLERARTLLGGLDDVMHDFGHVDRCASTAMLLGSVYQYAHPGIIEVGAWWHDVGRLSGAAGHEARSAGMLSQELLMAGADESVVPDFAQAVAYHKWSMRPSSLEGKIIRDADKLDAVAPERWRVWDAAACMGMTVPESELDLVSRVACDLDNLISLKSALLLVRMLRSELRDVARSLNNEKVSRFAAIAAT